MSQVSQYLILNKKNYFALADEYITLHSLFKTESLYEKLNLFMKLIGNILMLFVWKSSSIGLTMTLYRASADWVEYIRYLKLKSQIHEWKNIVHSTGGPFISTNDDTYHAYVYADGMQRLHNNLFGLTEKGTKCLK